MSMATTSQPLHHPPSAPACQAAPTATLPAPPRQSQTTARRAPRTAHVSDTASHEPATESSSTAVDPGAVTATIRLPAAPPMRKNTAHAAPAEMESWSDDDEPNFSEWEGGSEEEKHTSRSFVAAIYLFAHLIPRQAGPGVRPTRSRIRGPAVTMLMLWLRDFVVYDKFPHVL